MSGKDDLAEAFWREQVARMSHALMTLSETSERLATGVRDHVLYAGTVKLVDNGGGVGYWMGEWSATCGSAEISNDADNDDLVVVASTVQANPPSHGTGVYQVPSGVWRLVNVGQRVLTVYGTVGDVVGVQALTTGGVYGAGTLA